MACFLQTRGRARACVFSLLMFHLIRKKMKNLCDLKEVCIFDQRNEFATSCNNCLYASLQKSNITFQCIFCDIHKISFHAASWCTKWEERT